MKILEKIIDFPNKEWGEDRIFIGDDIAGVIDGSSPINVISIPPYHSQAEWLSDKLAKEILLHKEERLPNICKTITDALKGSESNILKRFNEYNLPCAVLSGVQARKGRLYGFVIGDCTLALQLQNGEIKIFTDKRINRFSNLTKEARMRASLSGEDEKEAVRQQMTRNRRSMNTENGFWTVALKGEYQKQFVECDYRIEEVKRCLLFSDGFERGIKNGLYSLSDVLKGRVSLSSALDELRKWEGSFIRSEVKKHDDVSALLIEL